MIKGQICYHIAAAATIFTWQPEVRNLTPAFNAELSLRFDGRGQIRQT